MSIKKAGKSKNRTRNQNVNSSNILTGHINLSLLFVLGKNMAFKTDYLNLAIDLWANEKVFAYRNCWFVFTHAKCINKLINYENLDLYLMK